MPTNTLEDRSQEVQEIIGQVPPWLIRWGITSVFIVVIVFLSISWFVSYPDVIKGSAIITTQSAPTELIVKQSGDIKLLVDDNNISVKKGQILAYIKSAVNFNDLLLIEDLLKNENFEKVPTDLQLGEIQTFYSTFLMAYYKKISQEEIEPQTKEIEYLNQQIRSLKSLNSNLNDQISVFREEIELLKDNFSRDSVLFKQNVIAESDFKNRKATFLQSQRSLKSQEATIINNEYQIQELERQIIRLKVDNTSVSTSLYQELENSKIELNSAINRWKNDYLFTSPIDGKVTFMDFLQDDKFVQSGEPIFTIIPSDDQFYARVIIPTQASGKVKNGQKVNIKLDNYPSHEYGIILGEVQSISEIPSSVTTKKELTYSIIVKLSNGLETTYGIHLPKQQLLIGQMEIITQNRRIIERVLGWLQELMN